MICTSYTLNGQSWSHSLWFSQSCGVPIEACCASATAETVARLDWRRGARSPLRFRCGHCSSKLSSSLDTTGILVLVNQRIFLKCPTVKSNICKKRLEFGGNNINTKHARGTLQLLHVKGATCEGVAEKGIMTHPVFIH